MNELRQDDRLVLATTVACILAIARYWRRAVPLLPVIQCVDRQDLGSTPHRQFEPCDMQSIACEFDGPEVHMRVILQSNSSSLYFCRGDYWTPRFKEAFDFGVLETAIEFSRHENLTDVQAVIIQERADGGVEFMPYSIQRLMNLPHSGSQELRT